MFVVSCAAKITAVANRMIAHVVESRHQVNRIWNRHTVNQQRCACDGDADKANAVIVNGKSSAWPNICDFCERA